MVGYGSIGRYHARVLAERYGKVAVVDRDQGACAHAIEHVEGVTTAASLIELDGARWPWESSLAVIATWGPSHGPLFGELVDLGVKRVLCEKPLCTSVAEGAEMVDRAKAHDVRLGVHLHKRYSGMVEGMRAVEARFGLGPLRSVVVHGGARCLVTNGLHYLDLACALFERMPSCVVSTARNDRINPRSADLGFYGGAATWSFDGGGEVTIAFTNGSSLYEQLHFYYRDAIVELSALDVAVVRRRPPAEVSPGHSVTRAGAASDTVFEGPLPGFEEFPGPTTRLLDELEEETPQRLAPSAAVEVVGACIGALASARDGVAVALPIRADSELGRERWPIS